MGLHSQTAAAVNNTQHCSSPEVKVINNFYYCTIFPAIWEKVIFFAKGKRKYLNSMNINAYYGNKRRS
jgi:hypothetical protein